MQTIAEFEELGAALEYSRSRKTVPVLPRVVGKGKDRALVTPDDAGYSMTPEMLALS